MRILWAAALVAALLLLYPAFPGAFGLYGPDEPRYADIARTMARTGDWISPVLYGEPWLEKPAMLYWLSGLGFQAGLAPEAAPRVPLGLLSAAFILFYGWRMRSLARAAILATCAGWIGYSNVAVTDVPLAVFFSAGMLLAYEWIESGSRTKALLAGVCFGLAMLTKGLVPVVLAAPLVWFARSRWRQWWIVAVAALVVALPWYAAVTWRHGWAFIDEFFLEHHFGRFAHGDLQHVQPVWFYVPMILVLLLPWTPLLWTREWKDPRRHFFAVWLVFGFVFFSLSKNKLPGYLIPLLPAAVGMMRLPRRRYVLAGTATMVGLVLFAKLYYLPANDTEVTGRELAKQVGPDSCSNEIPRAQRYAVQYYAGKALGECWDMPGARPVPAVAPARPPGLRLRVTKNVEGSTSGRLLFFASKQRTVGELVLPVPENPTLVWLGAREVADWEFGETIELDPNAISFPGPFREAGTGSWLLMLVFDANHSFPSSGLADGDLLSGVVPLEGEDPAEPQTLEISLDRKAPSAELRDAPEIRFRSPLLSRFHRKDVLIEAAPYRPVVLNAERPGVDSEVIGPWGRAIVEELLPRVDVASRTRLEGSGVYGWAALWLKQQYPDRFTSVEVRAPSPLDLHDFWGVDLYSRPRQLYTDQSGHPWMHPTIPGFTLAQSALRASVLGNEGGVWYTLESFYGPRTSEGYARQLFDRSTGAIDPVVLEDWLLHDLTRIYVEKKIDPSGIVIREPDASARSFCEKTGVRCVVN